MALQVLNVKQKWISVEMDGKNAEIPINWFTKTMVKGETFQRFGELRIKNSPHHEPFCSSCKKNLMISGGDYYTWKDTLRSRSCRHCGARFLNLRDMEDHRTLATLTYDRLNHMGMADL